MFKKLTSYNQFVADFDVYWSEQCNNLGIDYSYFVYEVLNKKEKELNNEDKKKCLKLTKNIMKCVNDAQVLRKLLTRILFVFSYGDVLDLSNNHFIGKLEYNNKIYSVNVILSDNVITCCSSFDEDISNIVYKKQSKQNIACYDEKIVKKFLHSSVDKTYFDVVNKRIVKFYDKNGIETFESNDIKKENYLIDGFGNISYPKADVSENYSIRKYFWRLNDYIIYKEEEKHVFDDTDDVFIKEHDGIRYYIGRDNTPDSLEINTPSYSFGIDENDKELYINKSISVDELYKKTRMRYNSRG